MCRVSMVARPLRGAVGRAVCSLLLLLTFASAIISPDKSAAQGRPTPEDVFFPESRRINDRSFVREIYRFDPKVSEELGKALESTSTEYERSTAIEKIDKQLQEQIDVLEQEKLEPSLVRKLRIVRSILDEMMDEDRARKSAAEKYREKFNFEDDVIKEAGFKGYEEFYQYLEWQFGSSGAKEYLEELRSLKEQTSDEKYKKKIEQGKASLKDFRIEKEDTVPESESIVPELQPYLSPEGRDIPRQAQPEPKTSPATEQPAPITAVQLPKAAFETVSAPAGPSVSVATGYRQQNLPRTNVGVISDLGGLHGSQSGTSDHQSDSSGAGSVKESPVARSDSSLNMFFASLGFGWTGNPANAALGGGPFYLAETDAGVDPSSTSDPGQDGFWFNATVAGGSETSRGIAPGGNANLQSAFVFLDNSLNGGIFTLGTAGQQVKVDTDLWTLDVDARKLFPLASGGSWKLSGGLGALVGFFNLEHDVSQFVTIAPAVNMKTRFKTHDYLVAPLFSLHLNTRSGPWFFTGEGFVAPGVLISDAEATQTFNLPPNSFKITIDDTDNEFAVRTGAHGALDLQVAPGVRVGVNGGVEYQSDVGVWRNPIILQNQPAKRVFEDTFNYSVGGHVRVQWGGAPGGPN